MAGSPLATAAWIGRNPEVVQQSSRALSDTSPVPNTSSRTARRIPKTQANERAVPPNQQSGTCWKKAPAAWERSSALSSRLSMEVDAKERRRRSSSSLRLAAATCRSVSPAYGPDALCTSRSRWGLHLSTPISSSRDASVLHTARACTGYAPTASCDSSAVVWVASHKRISRNTSSPAALGVTTFGCPFPKSSAAAGVGVGALPPWREVGLLLEPCRVDCRVKACTTGVVCGQA